MNQSQEMNEALGRKDEVLKRSELEDLMKEVVQKTNDLDAMVTKAVRGKDTFQGNLPPKNLDKDTDQLRKLAGKISRRVLGIDK